MRKKLVWSGLKSGAIEAFISLYEKSDTLSLAQLIDEIQSIHQKYFLAIELMSTDGNYLLIDMLRPHVLLFQKKHFEFLATMLQWPEFEYSLTWIPELEIIEILKNDRGVNFAFIKARLLEMENSINKSEENLFAVSADFREKILAYKGYLSHITKSKISV